MKCIVTLAARRPDQREAKVGQLERPMTVSIIVSRTDRAMLITR
jgi:hypothetical protein